MTEDKTRLIFVNTIKRIAEHPEIGQDRKAEILDQLKADMIQKCKDDIDIKIKRLIEIPDFIVLADQFHEQLSECLETYQDGSFRSTIALSGMIAEIITSGLIQEANIYVNGRLLSPDQKKILLDLSQYKKIEVLKAFKIITPEAVENLDKIRRLRNKYVHSSDSLNPERDAREIMGLLVNILKRLYNLGVKLVEKDGQKIQIQYLKREKVD